MNWQHFLIGAATAAIGSLFLHYVLEWVVALLNIRGWWRSYFMVLISFVSGMVVMVAIVIGTLMEAGYVK